MRYLTAVLVFVAAVCTSLWADETKPIPGQPHLEPGNVRIQPPKLPKPKGLALAVEAYPRTSGSTSAEPMGVWVACRLLRRECWWPNILGWGDRRLLPLKKDANPDPPIHKNIATKLYAKIRHSGTHGSYRRLILGENDLILECRLPSEDERKLMKSSKVKLDIRPIALDAFVFLRHRDNPVKALTLSQVRDIYTRGADGKARIKRWDQVGGPRADIHAYARNRNSGSQGTMLSLVMKDRPMVRGRSMVSMSMSGPYNSLHGDKLGIGFTFFYYQRYMAPLRSGGSIWTGRPTPGSKPSGSPVRMFSIDGVMPSRATIADRTYRLVTEVYVVTRKDLKRDHPAARLRDWLLTAEGQRIVGETGYVPITPARTR